MNTLLDRRNAANANAWRHRLAVHRGITAPAHPSTIVLEQFDTQHLEADLWLLELPSVGRNCRFFKRQAG